MAKRMAERVVPSVECGVTLRRKRMNLLGRSVAIVAVSLLVVRGTQADYSDVVLNDGPEAYYRFEEDAGAGTILDSSGNGHHSVSLANAVLGGNGRVGRAVQFDGDGSIVLNLNHNPAAGDFSVELLVALDGMNVPAVMVSQKNGSGTGRTVLSHGSSGYLASFLGGSEVNSLLTPSTENWYHVVLTYDADGTGNDLRFYVNGVAAGTVAATVEAANGRWVFGSARAQTANFLDGWLDEAAVYAYRLDDPNGDGNMGDSRIPAHVASLPPQTLHASPVGASRFPYASWANASTNIRDAVKAAWDGDTVLVTNGTYYSVKQNRVL